MEFGHDADKSIGKNAPNNRLVKRGEKLTCVFLRGEPFTESYFNMRIMSCEGVVVGFK